MLILRRVIVIVAVTLVVLTVAFVGVYLWQKPILLTGTGYAAHNACAVTEVAGRENPGTDLPDNPLVPYLQLDVNGDETTGTIEGLVAQQKAWYTEGFGCTISDERPELGAATSINGVRNPFTNAPTPASDPALDAAVARAFGDELSAEGAKEALGTRAVVIVKNGELVAERYADGFDKNTPQLGWSMSKSVTELMTGMLVKQGVISLDDDHLRPEWTDGRADITVENLLRMESGLEWDETYDLGTPITRMLYLEEDMGGYVASLPLESEPGSVQEYSSGSTTLLCSVLTERTGLGADLPRQTILRTLGLSSAVFEPDAVGTPVCSSYLWMTPRDWATVGQFALQDGAWQADQYLPEGWMQHSLTNVDYTSTDDPGYAMGFRTNLLPDGSLRWPELPEDTFYMSGHDGQKVLIAPSESLVVVRMGFTPGVDDAPSEVALVAEAIAALG